MVEAVVLAIRDRPVGEQRREAATPRRDDLVLAAHVQEGSCCPAKLASGRSSAVALERTATEARLPWPRHRYASRTC
jgi:hypothetical protein